MIFLPTIPTDYRCKLAEWSLSRRFGDREPDKLRFAHGTALCPSGDILVADYKMAQVNLYDKDGRIKTSMDTRRDLLPNQVSRPWQVVVSSEGMYVVTDATQYVKIFDSQGYFTTRFAAYGIDDVSSVDDIHTKLLGLSKDTDGNLLVGLKGSRPTVPCVSKHRNDGTHIISIPVHIPPKYLAVTSNNNIVISGSKWMRHTVEVVASNGDPLYSLEAPTGVQIWHPFGVYCSKDTIFVTNSTDIHCYSSVSGNHVKCITSNVTFPQSVVVSQDGSQIIVSLHDHMKVFKKINLSGFILRPHQLC